MEDQNTKVVTENPNNENHKSDKAFNRLIFTSVLSIVLCLFLLCSTTYAWFVDDVTQSGNELKTAEECLLSITVTNTVTGQELENIEIGVTLEANVPYEVTLSLPKDSSSGYCIVAVGANQYFSDYLTRHTSDTPKTLTFTVLCEDTFNEVTFKNHWGIYSRQGDVEGGVLTVKGRQSQ